MINTYRLHSLNLGSDIKVSYEDGKFKALEVEAPDFGVEDSHKLRYSIMYTEKEFLEVTKKHKVIVSLVDLNITFSMFWDKYAYKVGKPEAEKAWSKLSEIDRQQAYHYISAYEAFRKNSLHNKLYPASYLNARRWVK